MSCSDIEDDTIVGANVPYGTPVDGQKPNTTKQYHVQWKRLIADIKNQMEMTTSIDQRQKCT